MQIERTQTAYDIFIGIYAERNRVSEAEARKLISSEMVETRLAALHSQWLNGEFSFGRFTELMDVPHWELWEMLDAAHLRRSRSGLE